MIATVKKVEETRGAGPPAPRDIGNRDRHPEPERPIGAPAEQCPRRSEGRERRITRRGCNGDDARNRHRRERRNDLGGTQVERRHGQRGEEEQHDDGRSVAD